MIVGKLLEKALKGLYFEYKDSKGKVKKIYPQFWYGDQHELNRWVAKMTQGSKIKYPLIYYVTGSKVVRNGGWYRTNARIIILTDTKYNILNKERTEDVYLTRIYPTYDALVARFKVSNSINVYGDLKDKYATIDEPLWGITGNDFSKYQGKTESGTIDIVDATVLDLDLEVRDC